MLQLLLFGVPFLLLDQWSKAIVRSHVPQPCVYGSMLQIRFAINQRDLYKRPAVRAGLLGLWLVAAGSVVALHSSGIWFQSSSAMAGLGCALGGAAGNLLDISRRRHIVDFIDFGWWPVFNFADVGIVGGLTLAFLS